MVGSRLSGVSPGDPPIDGICVSGGGVRAAAFGLGALQALEKREGSVQGTPPDGSLPGAPPRTKAKYLVAVSGGSYIVGALYMLRSKFDNGIIKTDPIAEGEEAFATGSDEVEFIRRRAQYLLNGPGGSVELILQFVARLVLNIAFIALPVMIVGRVIGWVYGWSIPGLPGADVGVAKWVLVAGLGAVGVGLLWAILSIFRPALLAKKHLRLVGLVAIVVGLIGIVLSLIPWLVSGLTSDSVKATPPGLVPLDDTQAGTVTVFAAVGAVLAALGSFWVSARPILETVGRFPKLRTFLLKAARALISAAAAILLPLALFMLLVWMAQEATNKFPWRPGSDVITEVGLLVGGVVAWFGVAWAADPTIWSLNPFYKRRLMSCFCMMRKPPRESVSADGADNGPMAATSDGGTRDDKDDDLTVQERPYSTEYNWTDWQFGEQPELIIATAANISTFGGAPAGQNVLPFCISQKYIGFTNGRLDRTEPPLERFDTRQLIDACIAGGPNRPRLWPKKWKPWALRWSHDGRRNLKHLTLPAAIAITGAAFSPSMGKRTIAPIRMLLAAFNLRLGVWLPNPGNSKVREDVEQNMKLRRAPAAWYLLREYVGLNHRKSRFVYVSDGGHYENLGLVEVLRRGCLEIVCIDASGDAPGKPSTLAEAMRLAEAELNVKWNSQTSSALDNLGYDNETMEARKTKCPIVRRTWAQLEFQMDGKPGYVYVIKTGISKDTPEYLHRYQGEHNTFPYDSTGNQLFRADRFDAYRELGYHSALCALDERAALDRTPPEDGRRRSRRTALPALKP